MGRSIPRGVGEVVIRVIDKGEYRAWSYGGGEILQITWDENDFNIITKEDDGENTNFEILEVYA